MTTQRKMEEAGEIILKWGTLKGFKVPESNKEVHELLNRYHNLGACLSVAAQKDTDEQKQILVDMVSLPDMKIYLYWDGKYVTKEEAIDYIFNYGKMPAKQVRE